MFARTFETRAARRREPPRVVALMRISRLASPSRASPYHVGELAYMVRRRAGGRGQAADSHQGDDAGRLAAPRCPRFEGAREHAGEHVLESRGAPVEEGSGGAVL